MQTHARPALPALSRRRLLERTGLGIGGLALASLMGWYESSERDSARQGPRTPGPLAEKAPHFPPRARRVLHLFANGGPSHLDTFDPKPALDRWDGRALPVPGPPTERRTGRVMRSPFAFRKHGESGIEISELFPHLARHADDLLVVRSMRTDLPNHEPSLLLMNCGDSRSPKPSLGSWLTYGLGTENEDLPGFVVLCPGGYPLRETENWHSAFLPPVYGGTCIVDSGGGGAEEPIENLRNPLLSRREQSRQLDLVRDLNSGRQAASAGPESVAGRLESLELAYRMQTEASDAFDLHQEPPAVLERYGDGPQGRQLLTARRLLERGVRFVQAWHGAGQPWDSHEALRSNHRRLARECDRPIAALLTDLKERGLLEDTLVLWGGEFGRTPTVELKGGGPTAGRDHNPYGFTVWMAGGGVKAGSTHGATDELGFHAVDRPLHVHDLHATILHLMGLDHTRLTYEYAGREFRLTDVHGRVIRELLA